MSKQALNVYQFKVALEEVRPSIWRRIQVPENYSFWDLHVAIQDAMGWEDYHLHQFIIMNPESGKNDFIGLPEDESLYDEPRIIPGNQTQISSYFSAENNIANYEYDFGDSWQHQIVLEKILPSEKNMKYPICIGGKRACPPEDCGGIGGYENFLEAISDPKHEQYEEYSKWIGDDFDPEQFDVKYVEFDNSKVRWEKAFSH